MSQVRTGRTVMLVATLAIGLAASVGGCKDDKGGGGPSPTKENGGASTPAAAAAPVKVNAAEWAKAIQADPRGALEKYRGATIEVEGVIEDFPVVNRESSVGKPGLLLAGVKVSSYQNRQIRCFTTDPQPMAKVARGQTVTLRGTLDPGAVSEGVLDNCEIVKTGPGGPVELTAEKLAGDAALGEAAFRAKYAGKDLIVSGVVESKEGPRGAVLKAPVRLSFHVTGMDAEEPMQRMTALQPGQATKIWVMMKDRSADVSAEKGISIDANAVLK